MERLLSKPKSSGDDGEKREIERRGKRKKERISYNIRKGFPK
jgi:hypothetical protein